jgi:hypothetical protein
MPPCGMSDSLAGYPHWLVATGAVVLGLVALWVLVQLVKAALWILFYGIIAAALLAVAMYFFG